ncbi:MAG: hypothetical protein ONB30_05880 [candidate division KSB1 bacterium]|nr:hypothetical protein [candidate division KSB1 bacterium]
MAEGVLRERLAYVSLEDERVAGIQAGQVNLLVEEYHRLVSVPRHRHSGLVLRCNS